MRNTDIKEQSNDIYNSAFDLYGDNTKSVLWENQQSQFFRFNELINFIDLNDKSKTLLDVGCGMADMYKYLNFHGYRGKYSGIDINQKLISIARSKFENIDLAVSDILEENMTQKFDYVLMSGLFNLNMGQDMEWIKKFVSKMFEICKNHIAFNAISSYVNFKDDCMFYIDPFELSKFCMENLSKRITLKHHNLPYNYTLVIFKDEDLDLTLEK
jgi:SAM-dependent methyltransferase